MVSHKTPFTRSVFPSVWEWKAVLNLSFIPTSLENCLQNALVNLGSWSNTITLGNPWCLHHPLRKGYAVSNAVAVLTIGTMCANLANRSIINKLASYPCDSGKIMIKSMYILYHGLVVHLSMRSARNTMGTRGTLEWHPGLVTLLVRGPKWS